MSCRFVQEWFVARAHLALEVAMRSNAPTPDTRLQCLAHSRLPTTKSNHSNCADCCRVPLLIMYGMNQAYNAGGGDPSAQVPNHLVSAPAPAAVAVGGEDS
jgi:hypothetical protein